MVSCPSEMTPLTGTSSCSNWSLTSVSNVVRSPCELLSSGRAKRISSERQPRLDALVIRHAQRHQFFIALHQIGDTALRDAHPTHQQHAMHLRHTAVFAKAPPPNQSNHLQAKFAVWQRPASLFFGAVCYMIARALRLDTATHHHGQFPEAIQLGHGAMAVIAHPQQLTALFTLLFHRGQRHRVRRFGTRGSGSSHHARSPAVLFILLLSFSLHLLSSSLFRSGIKYDAN